MKYVPSIQGESCCPPAQVRHLSYAGCTASDLSCLMGLGMHHITSQFSPARLAAALSAAMILLIVVSIWQLIRQLQAAHLQSCLADVLGHIAAQGGLRTPELLCKLYGSLVRTSPYLGSAWAINA